jgi:class 3 adenylate cyclase
VETPPLPIADRDLLSSWTAQIATAALGGASEAELVDLLCANLGAAGFDLDTVEISCDTVDAERSNRFFLWQPQYPAHEAESVATPLFEHALANEAPMLRYRVGQQLPFAHEAAPGRIMREDVTDWIVFANHIEPDAALGLFDDVMSFFVTRRSGGFTDREIDLLKGVLPQFALAFSAKLNVSTTRTLLETYLGRDASLALLAGRSRLGDVGRVDAVVFYCDLLGFTGLTEQLTPGDLIRTLNLFFDAVTEPAARAGAQVSGHVGDAVVLFFPIASPENASEVCAGAVKSAEDALEALETLNANRPDMPQLHARIGLDIGEVVHGNIGSAGRFSFTIIGMPVNRAARLQALAKELGVSLLMTAEVADRAGSDRKSFGFHTLRGLDRPVEVVGIAQAHQERSPGAREI